MKRKKYLGNNNEITNLKITEKKRKQKQKHD